MNDQPQQPLERAVWWTEYVLRHGGRTHLRASGAGVAWTEYYEMELVITLLAVLISTLVFIVLAVKLMLIVIKCAKRLNLKLD